MIEVANTVPAIGDSVGETPEELQARRRENLNRFVGWCQTNPSTWLVSYQRSGRGWLSRLLETATGLSFPDPHDVNYSNYGDYPCYLSHSAGIINLRNKTKLTRVILLIRDPRDIVLSDAYRQVVRAEHAPNLHVMTPEMVDRTCDMVVKNWHERIQLYAHLCAYLVQYEQLCLFPERVLTDLLDLLELKPAMPVGEAARRLDADAIIHRAPEKNRLVLSIPNAVYKDDRSRYLHHCLKWTRDPMFMKRHNDKIWENLSEPMRTYGYTETGHDLRKWGIANA